MSTLLAINTTTGLSDAGQGAGYSLTQTPAELLGFGIQLVIGLLGVVFLILVLYAGFTWMTSMGNEKTVGKAKDILVRATVGLVIMISAYAISSYVIGALDVAVNGPGA